MIQPIRTTDASLLLLDQRLLPEREEYRELRDPGEIIAAIRDLVVRGAPAIGITAAFGLALAARQLPDEPASFRTALHEVATRFAAARPTAVNLGWALARMLAVAEAALARGEDVAAVRQGLWNAAQALLVRDIEDNRALGRHGADLVPERAGILTHCNAGALATGGYGTALGVVRAAVELGRDVHVLADETRPFLQGARLTAWELSRDGIPCTVITDGTAAHMMQRGDVDLVVVGADRIAANGDVANKIGTYGLAVLAQFHGIPFYVAAPTSTIDLATATGDTIPIEQRHGDEVAIFAGTRVVPEGVAAAYPAFDVTPARLVTAIVTERGVARAPLDASLRELCARSPERDA